MTPAHFFGAILINLLSAVIFQYDYWIPGLVVSGLAFWVFAYPSSTAQQGQPPDVLYKGGGQNLRVSASPERFLGHWVLACGAAIALQLVVGQSLYPWLNQGAPTASHDTLFVKATILSLLLSSILAVAQWSVLRRVTSAAGAWARVGVFMSTSSHVLYLAWSSSSLGGGEHSPLIYGLTRGLALGAGYGLVLRHSRAGLLLVSAFTITTTLSAYLLQSSGSLGTHLVLSLLPHATSGLVLMFSLRAGWLPAVQPNS